MEQNIAFALSIATMMAAVSAYVRSRRHLAAAEQRLNALRTNCFIRNDKNQFTRWTKADAGTRARAETTTERTA